MSVMRKDLAVPAPEVKVTRAVTVTRRRCLSSLRPALLSLTFTVAVLPALALNVADP